MDTDIMPARLKKTVTKGKIVQRIIVGLSGASGMPIAVRLLEALKENKEIETHLVMTKGAVETIKQETKYSAEDVKQLADVVYKLEDIGAAISSGTFKTMGMVVVPCSMKTVSGIATGFSNNLLLRAADVVLKEKRKLVLVARETPLNMIHLQNLYTLSQAGAVILPPMQTYYNLPETIDDMIDHTVGKILDCFDIEYDKLRRWK